MEWLDPPCFAEALALHMARHGDSCHHLHRAIVQPADRFDRKTIQHWAAGRKLPHSIVSFDMLARIERRYRLPAGYFRKKLGAFARAPRRCDSLNIPAAERRRLAWHLPEDFNTRPRREQDEILEWVRNVIISGSTDYRRYQARASKVRFALRFPMLSMIGSNTRCPTDQMAGGERTAPARLAHEVGELVRFKMATFTDVGAQRRGVWNAETASQKVEHLALMFGALSAKAESAVGGLGVPPERLTLGLLAFPAVWDWYLHWREARRGFFTIWEVNMLSLSLSLTREGTGWLRQNAWVADHLEPIPGLIAQADVDDACGKWDEACATVHRHSLTRLKEIERVVRVHRDPFEPILPILEAESPVGAYRLITREILRCMLDKRRHRRPAAEAVRGFLMLRLGLHLGVRQRNLRELLVCCREQRPRDERQLSELRRGELRWNCREEGWEVLIPCSAFKNADSSFFGRRAFRLSLPDIEGLYQWIDEYLAEHRHCLLGGARDPGTFFVKTVKRTSRNAAYSQASFYEAWRLVIQRYGIYNPYTQRGAIKGLLPHGPHSVRDVLATHVLKQTGSYEQASYAIQDTPEMVARHYGRFLPHDKAALAAKVLNLAWID